MKTRITLSVILLIFILSGCSKEKSEWTKWRGPDGDGVSKEEGLNPVKLDSTNILWKKDIGFGHSSISIEGDKCFISGCKEIISELDTISETSIYCLNLLSGKEVWKFSYKSGERRFPGPRSTQVIDLKKLYALSAEGMLYCLNISNGKLIWQTDLAADSLTKPDEWGYNPSPVIYKDYILLHLNRSGIALDKNDGKVVWNSEYESASWATAKIIKYKNQDAAVFVMVDSLMSIVDPLTGKLLTSYVRPTWKGNSDDVMIAGEGKLFTSNEMLDISGKEIKQIWRNDSIASNFRGGVVIGNFAYQFSDNRNKSYFYCVDLTTGRPKWFHDLGRFGSMMAVNDKLIIINGLGKIIIAEANPEEFKMIKELQVLSKEDKEENWCWTIPSYANGKLLIRNSKGETACIDIGN